MWLITAAVPDVTAAERHTALQAAARYALSRGITSVVDLGRWPFAGEDAPWADLEEVYDAAADDGQLPLRCAGRCGVPQVWEGCMTAQLIKCSHWSGVESWHAPA